MACAHIWKQEKRECLDAPLPENAGIGGQVRESRVGRIAIPEFFERVASGVNFDIGFDGVLLEGQSEMLTERSIDLGYEQLHSATCLEIICLLERQRRQSRKRN